MTVQGKAHCRSYVAAADLSSHQFKIIRINADGKANLAGDASSGVIGVLQNMPQSGEAAQVGVAPSELKVIAGGAVGSANLWIASDANGLAVVANSGEFCLGRSLETAAGSGVLLRTTVEPMRIGAQN